MQSLVRPFAKLDLISVNFPDVVHGFGVMRFDPCAFFEELINIVQGRSFPDIVRMGFKGQAPHGNSLAFQASKMFFHPGHQRYFLNFVYLHHGLQDLEIIINVAGRFFQCLNIFWKAASTVSNTGKQKSLPDSGVRADANSNGVDIGADHFTKVGDLVHESDLGGQERIGGVFGQFCRTFVHKNDRVSLAHKGSVKLIDDLLGPGGLCSYDDPFRFHEILHGNTLAQELRIGNYIKFDLRFFPDLSGYLFRSPYRHGAFIDDDHIVG